MAERYNFKYLPLVGKLPGKSMVEQTETAINELASVVYDNVGYVGNLAEEVQTANTNASNALDKATEALETSSRVYIKQIAAVDVNDYYDSELYYINNDGSTNIPVRDRGFLEVKTNDDKTACEQVFIADSTGTPYYRHGRITEQTLGEETTYVVTWGSWYQGATTEYVQAELQDYLPLSGGNITGDLSVTGTITGNVTGNVTGNADTATNATNDANGNPIASTYLPLSGGTMTGVLTNNGSTSIPINIKTTGTDYRDIQIESSDGNHRIAAIRASKTSEGRCEITIGVSATSNADPTGITISRSTTNIYATAPTPDATDNSQKIATTEFVRTIVPAGVVLAYARDAVPTGWLLCDGSAVSRTTYAALFSVIGTTYGTGNGSTTFNLPNLTDRFIQGNGTVGTKKDAGLPNITGAVQPMWDGSTGAKPSMDGSGAFAREKTGNIDYYIPGDSYSSNSNGSYTANFNASRSSKIYGKSSTVQPPALTMRYIIKY